MAIHRFVRRVLFLRCLIYSKVHSTPDKRGHEPIPMYDCSVPPRRAHRKSIWSYKRLIRVLSKVKYGPEQLRNLLRSEANMHDSAFMRCVEAFNVCDTDVIPITRSCNTENLGREGFYVVAFLSSTHECSLMQFSKQQSSCYRGVDAAM
eukprot:2523252-Amphidinium_carterae.3